MVYYFLFENMMKERAKKEFSRRFSVYFYPGAEYNEKNDGGGNPE